MFFIVLFITGLIKGILVTKLNMSPFDDAHFNFILPNLLFFAYIIYWLFKQEKRTFDPYLILFLIAYAGSLIWDYQDGYYGIKMALPALLFVIFHREHLQKASIKNLLFTYIPLFILPPLVLIYRALPKIRTVKVLDASRDTSHRKPLAIGLILGLFVLILLANLDPDFAQFLQISQWLDILENTVGSMLAYWGVFFYFFWLPSRAEVSSTEDARSLPSLIELAITTITTVSISYSLYDSYILLRAFRLLKLTFETIGKNTQMSYIELIILGGLCLFFTSYLLDSLAIFKNTETQKVAKIITSLVFVLILLLPPVYNILRILVTIYIPQFGLTARRLFGMYTAIAFIISFLFILITLANKDKNILSKTVLSFLIAIALFSFAIPNNILIAKWHWDGYLQGKNVDFEYLKKIKLDKWGGYFMKDLDHNTYQSDAVWGLFLAHQTRDTEKVNLYSSYILDNAGKEVAEVESLFARQQFKELVTNYGQDSYWYYEGAPLSELFIRRTSLDSRNKMVFTDYTKDELKKREFVSRNRYGNTFNANITSQQFEYYYAPIMLRPEVAYRRSKKYVSIGLDLNPSRKRNKLLVINNEMIPFWVENLNSGCEKKDGAEFRNTEFFNYCNSYMKRYSTKLQYPSIPKQLYIDTLLQKPEYGDSYVPPTQVEIR